MHYRLPIEFPPFGTLLSLRRLTFSCRIVDFASRGSESTNDIQSTRIHTATASYLKFAPHLKPADNRFKTDYALRLESRHLGDDVL